MTTKITDHVGDALDRRPEQLKDKDNFEDLLTVLATPAQGIEDALWQLLIGVRIEDAADDQLDRIGDLVGQARNGLADDLYRAYILARIAANKSQGTGEDVIRVVRQVINDADAYIHAMPQLIKTIVVCVEDVAVDADVAAIAAELFYAATTAGERPILEYSESAPAATFVFGVERDIEWVDDANVTVTDNEIERTTGGGAWDAGAASSDYINGDGWVEFSTDEDSTLKAAGLSNGDAAQTLADIDFAIYLDTNGDVDIYEGGALKASSVATYSAGDLFRVQVADGVVAYWHKAGSADWVLLYTSLTAPTMPLLLDASIYTANGTITGATVHWGLVDDVGLGFGDGDFASALEGIA